MTPRAPASLAFTLPIRTRSEANLRQHWAQRAKRTTQARGLARLVGGSRVLRAGARAWPGWAVTLTRVAPSNGLDGDNLQGALKAVRDGVADALGVDDRDDRVRWEYAQRRGPDGVDVTIAREPRAIRAGGVLQTGNRA